MAKSNVVTHKTLLLNSVFFVSFFSLNLTISPSNLFFNISLFFKLYFVIFFIFFLKSYIFFFVRLYISFMDLVFFFRFQLLTLDLLNIGFYNFFYLFSMNLF
jgi:hypothetical protein